VDRDFANVFFWFGTYCFPMTLEFALLNASFETDATSRNFHRELTASRTEFDVSENDFPDGYGFDAALITGSGASAYDDAPWIGRLLAWVGEAFDREIPLLGICFGAQVLAEALGGRVEGQDARELGYHTVRHSGDSPLFAGIDETFVSFASHGDDVVDLPLGARRLAQTDHALHAFRKEHAFGVLFHPDYDFETAEQIVGKRAHEPQRSGNAEASLTRENYAAAEESTRVFGNFEAYVRLQQ
jgi:GMP synthase (glutamine-hydrolysing)